MTDASAQAILVAVERNRLIETFLTASVHRDGLPTTTGVAATSVDRAQLLADELVRRRHSGGKP